MESDFWPISVEEVKQILMLQDSSSGDIETENYL